MPLASHIREMSYSRSMLGDLQLAPEVEARPFLVHERRHRLASFRLDLGEAIAVTRLGRVPDRNPDDLLAVGRVALVRAEHPLGKRARPPGAAELVARTRLQSSGRNPDVGLIELHAASLCANRGSTEPQAPS